MLIRNSADVFRSVLLMVILGISFPAYTDARNDLSSIDDSYRQIAAEWEKLEQLLLKRNILTVQLVQLYRGYEPEDALIRNLHLAKTDTEKAASITQRIKAFQKISGLLGEFLLRVGNYPEIQKDQNFQNLSNEMAGIENEISVSAMRYDKAVQAYSKLVDQKRLRCKTPHQAFIPFIDASKSKKVRF